MIRYGDDFLCISEYPDLALDRLGKYFTLRPVSVVPPKIYLEGKLSSAQFTNGVSNWIY